jgi:hypothetical protein
LLFINGSITGLADRANSKCQPGLCWGADEFLHLTGAAVITAQEIKTMNTASWLKEQIAA